MFEEGSKCLDGVRIRRLRWSVGSRPDTGAWRFDLASALHEDTLAKAAGALGRTFAGAVLYDDLAAFSVLAATWHRSRAPGNPGGRESVF
ncbi:MAG TPA: hypothetical protein VFP81_06175 [Propionibacteriaceae bacterium]|nr:hypothetical protein [Propionibacteriaceae bacterium]